MTGKEGTTETGPAAETSDPLSPDPVAPAAPEQAPALADQAQELVRAYFELAAHKSGVELPEGFHDFIDHSKLMNEDGTPDKARIEAFVSGLPAANIPKFDQSFSSGPQGGQRPGLITSRSQFEGMTYRQIYDAFQRGEVMLPEFDT